MKTYAYIICVCRNNTVGKGLDPKNMRNKRKREEARTGNHYKLSDIRDDRRGLKVRMPDFETTLSHPRSLAERFDLRGDYKFSCSGNYLMILNVRKRITTKETRESG
ncbi:unnamed protein product [Nesidiocoris tenuis]|uniref:Uncharacterized protein n=1 Tax=Nesidiocoris tenuis TaxID=355587 RepID=A0A6H5FY94_9HEMI|nr:unnamed protein product [Nesidiocoris tenuis]